MQIETIRTQFLDLLNDHFDVNSAKISTIDSSLIRNQELRDTEVISIEFIVNRTIRLHIYGIESNGEVFFTRPKEGIAEYIIAELRRYDFYFRMDGNINNRHNLFARIIDNVLGYQASEYIKNTLSFFSAESGNNFDYCFGFKIIYNHRYTKTFDAQFEVLVNKRGRYHTYRGDITNGDLQRVIDEDSCTVTMENVFEA
jgi:hypothetical protein